MRDPYVYPGTDTLINKYHIRNEYELREMEAEFTSFRLKQITEKPLPGNYDFQHFCNFHKYIFQDIYEWAGEPRTINIYKHEKILGGLSIEYSDFNSIETDVANALRNINKRNWSELKLSEKAEALALNIAELWKVHPFREGNTRAAITFCNQFAKSKGMHLATELFKENSAYMRTALVAASAVFTDLGDRSKPGYLIEIVQDALEKGNQEHLDELKKPKSHKGPERSLER